MTISSLKTNPTPAIAVLTATIFAIGVSGCSQPEPVDLNAAEYKLVTADDANEDIGTYVMPQDTAILYQTQNI